MKLLTEGPVRPGSGIQTSVLCRSDQPVPGGGPGGVPSSRVGAGLLPANGRHRGELAAELQVPAAHFLHLRPHVRLRRQGERDIMRISSELKQNK